MIYLIALLVTVSVVLLVYLAAQATAEKEQAVVARRLVELGVSESHAEAAAADRDSLRSATLRVLHSVGERMASTRKNLEQLRATLAHAGFTAPSAAAVYLAARTGMMLGAAVLALTVLPLLTGSARSGLLVLPYLVGLGWLAPRFWLARRATMRKLAIQRAIPDTLDLLVVCVEAGLGLNQALVRVAREMELLSPVLAYELRTLNMEIRAGTPRDEAFRNLADRTGVEELQSLAAMLIQADRFGTSVGQALRVQAETLRTKRRQRAEEAAAKTTVKLVFPLVFFIFPAIFVVVLGPALISIMASLGGM